MITEQEFRAIRERVLKASQADETELCLGGGREELTRFGENRITQNVSEERYELRVRTRFGRRQGLATTNDFSPAGLVRCVENAAALARIQPESERVIDFHAGGERSEATAWAAETAAVDAAARARWVETAVKVAAGQGIELGGIALSSEGSIGDYGEIEPFAVANSTGLLRYGRKTRAVFEVSAAKGDGAGRSRVLAKSATAVDPVRVAEDACRRCLESRAPAALAPGDYTVVFEAEAAQDLLFFLTYLGFNGLAVAEKRSPLGERLGERVFGENITLREVPGDPRLFGLGFDAEGVDTQAVTLIDKGVLTSFLHDRTSAHLTGQAATGHGLPQPNNAGAYLRFPVLAGGKASLAELIGGVERGVLVTRLWYTNVVDPMRMIITGMTRDGTFLIEKGALVGPVKNFRFNQSLVELFNRVEQLGEEQALGGMVLPHLRVRDFRFSSGTDF
jgi:PmbA protein